MLTLTCDRMNLPFRKDMTGFYVFDHKFEGELKDVYVYYTRPRIVCNGSDGAYVLRSDVTLYDAKDEQRLTTLQKRTVDLPLMTPELEAVRDKANQAMRKVLEDLYPSEPEPMVVPPTPEEIQKAEVEKVMKQIMEANPTLSSVQLASFLSMLVRQVPL